MEARALRGIGFAGPCVETVFPFALIPHPIHCETCEGRPGSGARHGIARAP
jgi:hypothetical protein